MRDEPELFIPDDKSYKVIVGRMPDQSMLNKNEFVGTVGHHRENLCFELDQKIAELRREFARLKAIFIVSAIAAIIVGLVL